MGIHIQPVKWGKNFAVWCREIYALAKITRQLWKLLRDGTWTVARQAVDAVRAQASLQDAALREENARFCPMCGQIPDGDRRMDHARSIAVEILRGRELRRSELDAAISLCYFAQK